MLIPLTVDGLCALPCPASFPCPGVTGAQEIHSTTHPGCGPSASASSPCSLAAHCCSGSDPPQHTTPHHVAAEVAACWGLLCLRHVQTKTPAITLDGGTTRICRRVLLTIYRGCGEHKNNSTGTRGCHQDVPNNHPMQGKPCQQGHEKEFALTGV
jgi:hypothetical protein